MLPLQSAAPLSAGRGVRVMSLSCGGSRQIQRRRVQRRYRYGDPCFVLQERGSQRRLAYRTAPAALTSTAAVRYEGLLPQPVAVSVQVR